MLACRTNSNSKLLSAAGALVDQASAEWQYLQLGLFCFPVQVLGLVLLQGILQLVLDLPAAGLCSLQLSQQLCTPATKKARYDVYNVNCTTYSLAVTMHRNHLTYATSFCFYLVSIITGVCRGCSL